MTPEIVIRGGIVMGARHADLADLNPPESVTAAIPLRSSMRLAKRASRLRRAFAIANASRCGAHGSRRTTSDYRVRL